MRLALGTAQLGLDYGIANERGQVSDAETRNILEDARANGIDTLDTAIDYGSSERRLGEIGIQGWHVISKLPAVPEGCSDIAGWVAESVAQSLQRLRIERLHGLLLHRPQQLLGPDGARLYAALRSIKDERLVRSIGVSIYDSADLEPLFARYELDLVQAPLNILDRRLVESGWLQRLPGRGTELHVRSVFLQGLLLMHPEQRPQQFRRWQAIWNRWDAWLQQSALTPLQACLRYALQFQQIGRIVVGVDSAAHLREVIAAADGPFPEAPGDLACGHQDLINPSRWLDKEHS